MMQSMQAHAAGAVPADADVAAYLKQLPQAAPADVVGEVLAMEAKAVHQVAPQASNNQQQHWFLTGIHKLSFNITEQVCPTSTG